MNAPTLLVGLGGTGCKIISKVSGLVTGDQRDNISFVGFDTDINELRVIQEQHPFVRVVQTSTRQTVGEYLNKDTHARDSWFPVNASLNSKVLSEGAGQVRSISRLALETVIRAGKMEPLHEAIQDLYKVEEDKVEQALRVVIVSSLAGGTGSGLILPISLYIRNYLATHYRQSANITRGFFILPEVFYEVIPGTAERNNLRANAYATLRELDAFLMKGDKTLPPKYENTVRIEFPRVASEGYEEYDVRPYDFCFLFDAQNAEGGKLNSFDQYLDHAANCIYAQSIGPMNKRSNSSEDNTIRKLAKERGRNRYAGAGASMLIYPYEDIRKLLALTWAKQCISEQWLYIDELYKESLEENKEKQEEGLSVKEVPLSTYYAAQVESDKDIEGKSFAKAIYNASGRYKNGVSRIGNKWQEYVEGVLAKIASDLAKSATDSSEKGEEAAGLVNALENDWEGFVEAYNAMDEYRWMSQSDTETIAPNIANAMYSKKIKLDTSADYKLETYLVDDDKNFLHPNAIRFLLIKILDLMKKHRITVEQQKLESKDFLDNFDRIFDDAKTEDVVETVDDLTARKVSFIKKLTKRPTSEQEAMKRKFRTYLETVENYQVQCVQSEVLGKGISYIDNLIKAFESFFNTLDSKIDSLDGSIRDIYKRYSTSKGTTVRYVCASDKCLDRICKVFSYKGGTITIDKDLAKEIYVRTLEYSVEKEKPKASRYFGGLFDEGIIGYFENSVMHNHALDLDVDVITAIEKEAKYLRLYEDDDDAVRLTEQYVKKTISDTRNLSCPFIESPLGEPRDAIPACTFNDEMVPAKGDESPRAQLIRRELMNYGGSPDKDIPKNMIMYYQSFYGLRANDLSKFAPPERSATYSRTGGEYFKSYFELVKGIHPKAEISKEISPHIDRWWHLVSKCPDLDEANHKKQEYDIYAAFFWAIMKKLIYRTEEGSEMIYKLLNERLGIDDDSLIVSNGTPCDKFYEILDAIAIYPELTAKIMRDVEDETREDLNEGKEIEDGLLMKYLNDYRVEEPGVGKDKDVSESIFDIPMLMKKSATPEIYYEEDVLSILRTELAEIKRYLLTLLSVGELPEVMGSIIKDQFDKHLAAVEKEQEIHRKIYSEPLFKKTCDIIINALKELGLKDDADAYRKKVDALK